VKDRLPIDPPDRGKPLRLITDGRVSIEKEWLLGNNEYAMECDMEVAWDTLADACIMPDRFLPKDFNFAHLAKCWKSGARITNVVGVSRHTVQVLGEVVLTTRFDNVDWSVRWMVTKGDALPYALIGNDFWPHAKANVDWVKGTVTLTTPGGDKVSLPVHGKGDTIECRLKSDIVIPAGTGVYAQVSIPRHRIEENWMLERVFTTSGELTIPTMMVQRRELGVLEITLQNRGNEEIRVQTKGLVAQATPVEKIREDGTTENTVKTSEAPGRWYDG
jgi:hypothetical protein